MEVFLRNKGDDNDDVRIERGTTNLSLQNKERETAKISAALELHVAPINPTIIVSRAENAFGGKL